MGWNMSFSQKLLSRFGHKKQLLSKAAFMFFERKILSKTAKLFFLEITSEIKHDLIN